MADITLNELVKETGFEKRQILNWYKRGLLPEPIDVQNTGREAGMVLYFQEEALNRLRSIQKYPVSKLTKTMGLDSLAFLLFLYGFNDEKLCEMVRSFLLSTVKYFQKSWRKEIRKKGRDSLIEAKGDPFPDTPTELVQAGLARLLGDPKKDVKELIPQDTGSEIYDSLLNAIQPVIEPVFNLAAMPFEMPDFLELYLQSIIKYLPGIPSLKEMKNHIIKFSKNDFDKLQINLLFSVGFLSRNILGEEKVNEILREKIQLKNFMGLTLAILYVHFIFSNNIKLKDKFFKDSELVVEETKLISSQSHDKKKPKKVKKIETC